MLLHIPHSSLCIPEEFRDTYSIDITDELNLMTDHFTDDLFIDYYGTDTLIFPISRLVCDVERFMDDSMEERGMGICYTKTFDGEVLRDISNTDKDNIINTYYKSHHDHLNRWTRRTLPIIPPFIVDCHSFSERMVVGMSPDFCIGANPKHTPMGIVTLIGECLSSRGYNFCINYPFSGCVIPSDYTNSLDVKAVMIEVNRSLYLSDDYKKSNNYNNIKDTLSEIMELMDRYMFDNY